MKIDETVRRETVNIAIGTLILSVLMESVFLLLGKWDYTVLLGNLLGMFGAIMNFFLMGLTVQSAVRQEQKGATTKMKASQMLRMLMLFVVAILGAVLPCFQIFAVLIPFFFPRITIMCRFFSLKKAEKKAQDNGGEKLE